MGGLVPLLKGKRTSKIRPEFVIFDPQVEDVVTTLSTYSSDTNKSLSSHSTSGSGRNGNTDTSESESDDLCRKFLKGLLLSEWFLNYFPLIISQRFTEDATEEKNSIEKALI